MFQLTFTPRQVVAPEPVSLTRSVADPLKFEPVMAEEAHLTGEGERVAGPPTVLYVAGEPTASGWQTRNILKSKLKHRNST